MTKRFRPSLRQYRILKAANKELITINHKWFYDNIELINRAYNYKKNGDRAIRLNWFLLALAAAYLFKDLFQFFTR